MHPNERAFLDMLAISEGTANFGDRGYNCLVGHTVIRSYARHPEILVTLLDKSGKPVINKKNGKPLRSTAAGRYQFLAGTWADLATKLKLKDFGPENQDKACLYIIENWCKAGDEIRAGRIVEAIRLCRTIWASLPGAGYGQPEHTVEKLLAAYRRAGGNVA